MLMLKLMVEIKPRKQVNQAEAWLEGMFHYYTNFLCCHNECEQN